MDGLRLIATNWGGVELRLTKTGLRRADGHLAMSLFLEGNKFIAAIL